MGIQVSFCSVSDIGVLRGKDANRETHALIRLFSPLQTAPGILFATSAMTTTRFPPVRDVAASMRTTASDPVTKPLNLRSLEPFV